MPYNLKQFPSITLIPAYGRIYESEQEAFADWIGERDFKISNGGPYTSIRDHKTMRKTVEMIVIQWKPGFYLEVTNHGE